MQRRGEIAIDSYCLDELMRDLVGHDRRPSACLLYLHLWGQAAASESGPPPASLSQLAERTGLSKRSVQQGLQWLERRRLVLLERESATAAARIRLLQPWRARRR